MAQDMEVVGLIPAAGNGRRISPLPCSKELYPVGFHTVEGSREPCAKVVSHYLLEKFRMAGITKAYIILREGKWDIPAYFIDGGMVGVKLAYLVITDSCGPPVTMDRAYPFLENKVVAFGFPDIIFSPLDIFDQLLHQLDVRNSDAVLGLYRAQDCRSMDMVEVDHKGRIASMVLKPEKTDLSYAWICAVWTPTFSEFLHEFVALAEKQDDCSGDFRKQGIDAQGDLPVGAVIQTAIQKGLNVDGVCFPNGTYIDIGTPQDLLRAVRSFSN